MVRAANNDGGGRWKLAITAAIPKPLILCIDEYENILNGWKTLLEEEGYRAITAARWEEAIRLFSTEPVQEVMLDFAATRNARIHRCSTDEAD